METHLSDRITTNPGIFNGRPIIRGIRFGVADVLGYLAAGMTVEEILTDFPFLEKEDIIASLEYAQKKVDHSIITIKLDATK
ncbi:MAG TPA: DUF433 domain-containing protein [Hanamia sp.]